MALNPHAPALPVPAWMDVQGNSIPPEYGLTARQYTTIEMSKALIGRKDSMIFNKAELAHEALEMANALLEVL